MAPVEAGVAVTVAERSVAERRVAAATTAATTAAAATVAATVVAKAAAMAAAMVAGKEEETAEEAMGEAKAVGLVASAALLIQLWQAAEAPYEGGRGYTTASRMQHSARRRRRHENIMMCGTHSRESADDTWTV